MFKKEAESVHEERAESQQLRTGMGNDEVKDTKTSTGASANNADKNGGQKFEYVCKEEKIRLKIAEVYINVNVDKKMEEQMERSTKKKPPKTTTMSIIWTGHKERKEAELQVKNTGSESKKQSNLEVLGQLEAYPQQGSVFIGFATHQTTGCSAHMAAALIPTVERESIDFVDPALAQWNQELITIFGISMRILYDAEIESFSGYFDKAGDNKSIGDMLRDEESMEIFRSSAQAMRFFTPQHSVPSTIPGQLLRHVFFMCTKEPITILTTAGPLPAPKARLYVPFRGQRSASEMRKEWIGKATDHPMLLDTLSRLPLVTPENYEDGTEMLSMLIEAGQIVPLEISDVILELRRREALDCKQVTGILQWMLTQSGASRSERRSLVDNIRVKVNAYDYGHKKTGMRKATQTTTESVDDTCVEWPTFVIRLGHMHYFYNSKHMPVFDIPELSSLGAETVKRVIGRPQSELPVPEETLPLAISNNFTNSKLEEIFEGHWNGVRNGIEELPVSKWLKHIVLNSKVMYGLTQSAGSGPQSYPTAFQILATLSKNWTRVGSEQKAVIISMLDRVPIIPTVNGLKPPQEAYFPSANLFSDVAIITSQVTNGIKEQLLRELGVKKHVELQQIFDRLETDLKWDYVQLIKYLTGIYKNLSHTEIVKLKTAHIFPGALLQEGSTSGQPTVRNYCANKLLFPNEKLAKLGFVVLHWDPPYKNLEYTSEWDFMSSLGMMKHPEQLSLLQIAASAPIVTSVVDNIKDSFIIETTLFDREIDVDSTNKRVLALSYLLDNFDSVEEKYSKAKYHEIAFLPAINCRKVMNESHDGGFVYKYSVQLKSPDQCYSDPACGVFGYSVLDKKYHRYSERLGVKREPKARELAKKLCETKLDTFEEAQMVFGYLSSRLSDFSDHELKVLKTTKIVPIFSGDTNKDKESNKIQLAKHYISPNSCYFSIKNVELGTTKSGQKQLFQTIDFGQKANLFLRSCGVKDEPNPADLANKMMGDENTQGDISGPRGFLDEIGGSYDEYFRMIKYLAGYSMELKENYPHLWRQMRSVPWLICTQYKHQNQQKDLGKEKESIEDDQSSTNNRLEYELGSVSDTVLVDDTFLAQQLNPKCCPRDPVLEQFYEKLGCSWLRKTVQITNIPTGDPEITEDSEKLETLIKTRAALLLYEFSKDRVTKRGVDWLRNCLSVRQVDRIQCQYLYKISKTRYTSYTTACCSTLSVSSMPSSSSYSSSNRQDNRNRYTNSNNNSSIFGSIYSAYIQAVKDDVCILIAPISANSAPVDTNSDGFWDPFDIGLAIGTLTLKTCKLNDALLISTLLTSSLENLRRKGFPVDRLLYRNTSIEPDLIIHPPSKQNITDSRPNKPINPPPTSTGTMQAVDIKKSAQEADPVSSPPPYRPPEYASKGEVVISLQARLEAKYPSHTKEHLKKVVTQVTNKYKDEKQLSNGSVDFEDLVRQCEQIINTEQQPRQKPANNPLSTLLNTAGLQRTLNEAVKSTPAISGIDGKTMVKHQNSRDVGIHSNPSASGSSGGNGSGSGFDSKLLRNSLSKLFGANFDNNTNRGRASSLNKPNTPPISTELPSEFPLNPPQQQQKQQTYSSAMDKRYDNLGNNNNNNGLLLPSQVTPENLEANFGCSPLSSQTLKYYSQVNGLDVYLDSTASTSNTTPPISQQNLANLPKFSKLLILLADKVFGMQDKTTMHIFIAEDANVIAFNRARVLFFNLSFYTRLGHASDSNRLSALSFWFVTTCHELAHHFTTNHDQVHAYYSEKFAELYMPKLLEL
ncbi:hypothetical protein AX774_g877 [Zancudomyces culisetae]|uniref:Uncharacterized protein n=1 Tax=Zancudomyces culisetae TaxID=1213189 RepID=A0A1R1PXC3_ZANCU|nr:hypothetical protein AX774_g877 [Zancudomyces culisetae]|eukprot:OMH85589.1 hypothetical protein AX774_g877 [Zancudomyces culisetae]